MTLREEILRESGYEADDISEEKELINNWAQKYNIKIPKKAVTELAKIIVNKENGYVNALKRAYSINKINR